ncbi:unnamed protein product [Rotaria socialis]|uniref:Uncharacterized protein n=2 Tax=Rotaria socialis TaxID=392032 RepID=A0A821J738_9BILA|nr:unnamed protein product [Rotaria socialis]CAF3619304.1 unnamed protein product [Rotaria socialis]CAF3734139.1 unnamed protein product [Rotaria socialis]CAF4339774.1 unnamed protein product [Rotaria socialis]CAF4587235.1 unnamed protein product [Rotaria socialis]
MTSSNRLLIPSISYTYSMMIGFICMGICFFCTLCCIITRIIYEREKRERKITNIHRLMINLPEIDVNELQGNILKEKDLPLGYGQMMSMLGKNVKEMDEFKKQLQMLPVTIAEKLGNFSKADKVDHLQRALVENQFHF